MSSFFRDMDEQSRKKMAWKMHTSKEYEKLTHRWKAPFEKKQMKKAQKELKEAQEEPVQAQDAVIYVHSPDKGVTIPAHPEEVFAVIRLNGKQVKVMNNELIRVEKLPFEVGQQICISDVLLVGTVDYTAVGRPNVQNCKVYATLETEATCEKSIVFKKRRRKGYQKSQGHR